MASWSRSTTFARRSPGWALVAERPNIFFLPAPSDLRLQWVEARMAALHPVEMRELVLDAWRMVVPHKVWRSRVPG